MSGFTSSFWEGIRARSTSNLVVEVRWEYLDPTRPCLQWNSQKGTVQKRPHEKNSSQKGVAKKDGFSCIGGVTV